MSYELSIGSSGPKVLGPSYKLKYSKVLKLFVP